MLSRSLQVRLRVPSFPFRGPTSRQEEFQLRMRPAPARLVLIRAGSTMTCADAWEPQPEDRTPFIHKCEHLRELDAAGITGEHRVRPCSRPFRFTKGVVSNSKWWTHLQVTPCWCIWFLVTPLCCFHDICSSCSVRQPMFSRSWRHGRVVPTNQLRKTALETLLSICLMKLQRSQSRAGTRRSVCLS